LAVDRSDNELKLWAAPVQLQGDLVAGVQVQQGLQLQLQFADHAL